MKLGYARSWAAVLKSLSLGGFSVVSDDQASGQLSVEFTEIELVTEDESLLGLVGNFLDSRSAEDQLIPALEYKVAVTQSPNKVIVKISNKNNIPLDQLMKIKLLKIIRGNLS
jgi:uncharacterized lipoprotein